MAYDKEEFPPLLEEGLHPMTMRALKELCVESGRFVGSKTRGDIMAGLELVLSRIEHAVIRGDVWVDGSFLTEKIDAGDADIVLLTSRKYYDSGTPEQYDTIEWLINSENDPRQSCMCHTDVCWRPEESDPERELWLETQEHWRKIYGHSVGTGEPKGIAVIAVPEGVHG